MMPINPVTFQGRFALHYNSPEKSTQQVRDELKADGITPTDSIEKDMVCKDPRGNVWFDKVLLIEVPDEQDGRLFDPYFSSPVGRYDQLPYMLDAYQQWNLDPATTTLKDDADQYDTFECRIKVST